MDKNQTRQPFVDARGKEHPTLSAGLRAELKELFIFFRWLARRRLQR